MFDQRKYQCFCCHENFNNLEEYKQHILDVHEEGRDFIICPLARCGFPVRDLISHFKAKHPRDPIPKSGQLKAIVWKDIQNKRGKKSNKPNYKQGFYPSEKMGTKFKYRSSYEETVYQCLDQWNEVIGFSAEPFKIPYLYKGKAHKYIPDIRVNFVNGSVEVWEIKPEGQNSLDINKAKWFAAEQACKTRGWNFIVMNEVDISKLRKKVKIQGLDNLMEGV